MPVPEHHGAEHDVFGQLLRFPSSTIMTASWGAGDDEVELTCGISSSVGLSTYHC